MIRPFPAPTFGHAAEAFVIAHAAPGAWAEGTAVKYRQTLAALDGKPAASDPSTAADVAVLGTPAGVAALEAPFTAAFGTLAPATRARHLSTLRSAIAWWARPKVPVDTTRALTRAGRRDLEARRPAAGQGAVADAVRDRRPRRGDPPP